MKPSLRQVRHALAASVAWMLLIASFWPSASFAEERFALGLFAPSIDFRDGVARNAFVSKIARQLTDGTDASWSGVAFARRGDFEARIKAGELDLVIVDMGYLSQKGGGWTPVASASAGGSTRVALVVLTRKATAARLSELKGKALVTAQTGQSLEGLLTASLLEGEIEAGRFFSRIQEVKDARAALNAVDLGKTDAALTLASYSGDLRVIATLPALPLPVVAAVSVRLRESATMAQARSVISSLSASGGAPIDRFTTYAASDLLFYRSTLRSKKTEYTPLSREPAPYRPPSLAPLALPERSLSLPPTKVNDLLLLPSLPGEPAAPAP